MTDAEYHQQQLEQQELEEQVAYIYDEFDYETKLHIWGCQDTIFVDVNTNSMHFSLHLSVDQADIMARLLNNALRRAR